MMKNGNTNNIKLVLFDSNINTSYSETYTLDDIFFELNEFTGLKNYISYIYMLNKMYLLENNITDINFNSEIFIGKDFKRLWRRKRYKKCEKMYYHVDYIYEDILKALKDYYDIIKQGELK